MKNLIRLLFLLGLLLTNYLLFASSSFEHEKLILQNWSNYQKLTTSDAPITETQILRLEFRVSNGASRSFVIGFAENTTDGFDYGYDGGLILDHPVDDMGSLLNGQQYVIQAFAPITPDKEIDLVLHASGNFNYTLISTEITNFPQDQDLFLRDNLTGQHFDLRSLKGYNFTSASGTFMDRFQVIFQDPALSSEEFINDRPVIFVNHIEDKLYVKDLINRANQLSFISMQGQIVNSIDGISSHTLENGFNISNLKNGVYIVRIKTDEKIINKKILIN